MQSLRARAMRGGAFLALRQGGGLVIALGGTVALTRLLGPSGYGRAAAALALLTYLSSVAQLGVNAWLVRRRDGGSDAPGDAAPSATADDAYARRAEATARTLLTATGIVAALAGIAALPLLERWWGGIGVAPVALAFLVGLPLQVQTLVPLAALERRLEYRRVAASELLGQAALYVVSVALVVAGAGPLGVAGGWWAQQLVLIAVLQRQSGIGVHFGFDRGIAREAWSYGASYAASIWTWQLRELVNPLLVGRFVGVEGVAAVALTVRLVDAAAFVKTAVWRLALPALAKLRDTPARLAQAVREGMLVQVAVLLPIFLVLVWAGPAVIPAVFGERWRAVLPLLPFVCAGVLGNALFNLHSSALYALGRNHWVTLFHATHVVLFASAARWWLPVHGVVGYGYAELAALPAYAVVYLAYARVVRGALQASSPDSLPDSLPTAPDGGPHAAA